jgi:hypothetical protein
MVTNFDILIDASGSMGYMKGAGEEHQNKYLLPDGSTRTDLVKKILINSVIPKLSFVNKIHLLSFRNIKKLNIQGQPIVVNNKYDEKPINQNHYEGQFDETKLNDIISKIKDPEPGGTPLFFSLTSLINQKDEDDFNIIILSDGDANDNEEFDKEILKQIKEGNKKCKIYFIGIDQDAEAQRKSKNLAHKTNGFHVNLGIMNYDEKVFDSLLFDFQANITATAIKENMEISHPKVTVTADETTEITPEVSEDIEGEIIKEDTNSLNSIIEKEIEVDARESVDQEFDIKKQVEVNTQSLKLISTQLDSIVKEISFIRKGKTIDEDEFVVNEDEELNKLIGYECEKFHSNYLKSKWKQTNWLNEVKEESKPYDFEIVYDNKTVYVECKGTITNTNEFFLTLKEWKFYLQNRDNYRLYFIYDIKTAEPKFIRIQDLLTSMEKGELIPCSTKNRKVKAGRILFQVIN